MCMYTHIQVDFKMVNFMICGFYLNKCYLCMYTHDIYISVKICVCICMSMYVQLPWKMLEERIKRLKEAFLSCYIMFSQMTKWPTRRLCFMRAPRGYTIHQSHHRYSDKRGTNITKKFSGSTFLQAGREGWWKR